MDKHILNQYIDACALVKETEEEIRKLQKRRQTIVQGVVKGSMQNFPYTKKNFHVAGVPYSVVQNPGQLEAEEKLLEERRAAAETIKQQVEVWINSLPMRMQRIIKYKVFEGLSWEESAIKIGKKATGEGIRKEFERFLKNS